MCSDRSTADMRRWVSPFGHPRIEAWSAAPRGFSQPPTSFIGFRRQGIHRWLFVAWKTKMLVLAMEFSRGAGHIEPTTRRGRRAAAPPENGTEDCLGISPAGHGRPKSSTMTWRLGCQLASDQLGVLRPKMSEQVLLRKEVIQPHLPVRLPCYDFTPITDPTFDGSLLTGWATGFGCCRLSWCDGRCVQGPGTYSPRRC